MASIPQRRVLAYSVAYLRISNGTNELREREFSRYLCLIGYCQDSREALLSARNLIQKYDFSCSGQLCFDDFLLAMENIELQMEELRDYLEQSLRYFCRRKLEQSSESPFNIKDVITILSALPTELAIYVLDDIDADVADLFSLERRLPHQASEAAAYFASLQPPGNNNGMMMMMNNTNNDGSVRMSKVNQGNATGGAGALASILSPFRLFGGRGDVEGPSNPIEMTNKAIAQQPQPASFSALSTPSQGQTPVGALPTLPIGGPALFPGGANMSMMMKSMPAPMMRPELFALPESSLVELIIKRSFPKRTELILYEQYQGHRSLELSLLSMSVRNLERFQHPKIHLQQGVLDYAGIDPMFVISCDGVMATSKPLRNYHLRQASEDILVLEIDLPGSRSDDIIEWADKIELMVSVFDYNDGGVSPWAEWIGSGRRRLSWFLDNAVDGSPVACHINLECSEMVPCKADRPVVEFSISIPESLVKLWHAYRERNVHPNARVLNECIRLGLQTCPYVERYVPEGEVARVINFDFYAYWKRKRTQLKSRFPRRHVQTLAQDEYGRVTFLPCFLQPLQGAGMEGREEAANCVAALNSGLIPCCDVTQSSFQLEMIQPLGVGLLCQKLSSMEAAILLCSLFLGLGSSSYIVLSEKEQPWVITVDEKRTFAPQGEVISRNSSRVSLYSAGSSAPLKNDSRGISRSESKQSFQFSKKNSTPPATSPKPKRGAKPVYRREREKNTVDLDRETCTVTFWNPSTGSSYDESSSEVPQSVYGIFNHENVWFNVQRSEKIKRCTWNSIHRNPRRWEPFLSDDVVYMLGRLQRTYDVPDFSLATTPPSQRSSRLETKIFLSDIVDAISIYRQHELFLPDTLFDSKISKALQQDLHSAFQNFDAQTTLQDQEDSIMSSLAYENGMPRAISNNLPPGMMFRGRMFMFKGGSVQEVMIKLQEVGILNHTFPGLRYIVSAMVKPMPWGLSLIYLYIGVVHEISMDLPVN